MGDKETFPQRLAELRLNPDALRYVRVIHKGHTTIIPNEEGKRGSLQVFAYITSADSRITPEAAKKGLEIFGEELRAESRAHPRMHPNINLLENIARTDKNVASYVVRDDFAKRMPFTREKLESIASEFRTPFIIYDEEGIRKTLKSIYSAFSWNKGFKEFFAVKACPNPSILEICKDEGAGADCSSDPELTLVNNAVGLIGEDIMFTSNNTPAREFLLANNLGAIINLDDITHIDFFERKVGGFPELCCVRYNPGAERVGNSIIGNPVEAKYGMTKPQIFEAFKILRSRGIKRFGLHTMIASNELNPQYHIDTAVMLFNLVKEVKQKLGRNVEFVNTGGGWGVNYKPEQKPINPAEIGEGVKEAYDKIIIAGGLKPLKVFMENGRFVTGPNGWLVSRVIHEKHIYRDYIGVDACKEDYARPGAYGIYQHVIIPGKENLPHNQIYDVTGGLCENCDKFAVQRALPKIEIGDLLVLCDAGAHGRAMGSNYNGKLRCQELLLRRDGKVEMIRRAEKADDYFATLNFRGSRFSDL